MAVNYHRRHIILIWGALECFFFSGIVFGWPGFLTEILAHTGYFSDVCTNIGNDSNDSVTDLLTSDVDPPTEVTLDTIGSDVRRVISSNLVQDGKRNLTNALHKIQQTNADDDDDNNHNNYEPYDSDVFRMLHTNETCRLQRDEIHIVYVVAISIMCILSLFGGIFYDLFGTMRTRIIVMVLFTVSTLLVAFTAPHQPWLLYVSMSLLSFAGLLLLMTNVQVANLFGSKRYTVMAFYVGTFDTSRLILFLIEKTTEVGINAQLSFMFITVCIIPFLIGTIALLPNRQIPWPLPEHYGKDKRRSSYQDIRQDSFQKGDRGGSQKRRKQLPPKISFKQAALSSIYFTHVIWYSLLSLRMNYYEDHLTENVKNLTQQHNVDKYLRLYQYFQFMGVAIAPLVGLIMDRQTHNLKGRTKMKQNICNATIVHILVVIVTVVQMVLLLYPSANVLLPAFAFQCISRSMLYATNVTTLNLLFPQMYFGRLFGICLFASASIVRPIQILLEYITIEQLNKDPLWIHVTLLVLTLLSAVYAVIIRLKRNVLCYKSTECAGLQISNGSETEHENDRLKSVQTLTDRQTESSI
ncbi:equilibrative nucleobase transporter 1-like [Tubulanus polymorphus]|uniref:equilibrative nucleobase transporter 1-like n=1 Tax=Tubulanus polymorphus TaxID=672921 RepID=UPI003DA32EB8